MLERSCALSISALTLEMASIVHIAIPYAKIILILAALRVSLRARHLLQCHSRFTDDWRKYRGKQSSDVRVALVRFEAVCIADFVG